MRFLTCTSEGLLEERKQDRYDDACFNCLSENNQKYRNREDHHSHFPFPTRFPVVRGVCSLCEEGAGGGQEDGIDLGRSSPLSDDLMGVELIRYIPTENGWCYGSCHSSVRNQFIRRLRLALLIIRRMRGQDATKSYISPISWRLDQPIIR